VALGFRFKFGRSLRITTCVVLVLLPFVYCFDLHFIVIGYLRNEPCYRGRPATYWKAQFQSRNRWRRDSGEEFTRALLIALDKINIHPSVGDPITVGDRSAIPVLLFLVQHSDLAHDSDPEVRGEAIGLLGCLDPPDDRAIGPIIDALSSHDMGVRLAAINALQAYGPRARNAVPKLIALADNPTYGRDIRQSLKQIDPEELKKLKPLR
jgi:hypothetical protein